MGFQVLGFLRTLACGFRNLIRKSLPNGPDVGLGMMGLSSSSYFQVAQVVAGQEKRHPVILAHRIAIYSPTEWLFRQQDASRFVFLQF